MNKREKEQMRRQEDAALNKFLYWAAGAAILDFILLAIRRYRVDFTVDELELAEAVLLGSQVATFVLLALAVLAGIWAVRRWRKGKRSYFPGALTVFLAGGALAAYVVWHDSDGLKIYTLVAVYVVAAVLALIYYLYQRDFFLIALVSAASILGVWLFSQLGRRLYAYVVLALAAVLFVAVAAFARYLQGSKGVLRQGRLTLRILPVKANYLLIYVSCALMLVFLVATLFLIGGGIPTGVFYAVPVAWLFIMAVYYTVKLM